MNDELYMRWLLRIGWTALLAGGMLILWWGIKALLDSIGHSLAGI